MAGCRVESRPLSSRRHNCPSGCETSWFDSTQSQKPWGRLRGIKRHEGAGLLEAIQERFEQLTHGRKGIVVKQGSQPLPEHTLARSEERRVGKEWRCL